MNSPRMKAGALPAIVSISSHVVRGAVGNRSSVFVLESLGFPAWSVPTIVLPWHPGHGKAARIAPDGELFAQMLDELSSCRWTGEVGAILTGYMANAAQIEAAARFVTAMKERDPRLVYLCDPVIGDHGGLYVSSEVATAMRDKLLPLADLATPNRHELAWLAGAGRLETASEVTSAALSLPVQTVLATSSPAFMRGNIANILVHEGRSFMAEHRLVDGPPNGSGDLVSALFLAHWIEGLSPEDALARTTASIFEIVARAAARGSDELMPQADRESLLRPSTMIAVRSLARPAGAAR